jgi:DNA ligase D-like protein (predicted 3'-phosphoesterase)
MRDRTVSDADRRLDAYRGKRNATKTNEPMPGTRGGRAEAPCFVIQEHHASRLHWDFRLEVDDVLVSWAVPKGPSTDPRDKRLAVRTEDHPLEYADFEGIIPAGEYGGGAVIVWDCGTYANLRSDESPPRSMGASLEDGQIEVFLRGQKLTGGYALVHARLGGQEENWLLIKKKDDFADARRNPTQTEPESVLSGRTAKQLQQEEAT